MRTATPVRASTSRTISTKTPVAVSIRSLVLHLAALVVAIVGAVCLSAPAQAVTASGGGCGGPYTYANNQVTLNPCIAWDGSNVTETGGGSWTLQGNASINIYLERRPSGGSWKQVNKLTVQPYSPAPFKLGYYGTGDYRIEIYLYVDGVKYGEDAYSAVLTIS
jgi:hypothetical protein